MNNMIQKALSAALISVLVLIVAMAGPVWAEAPAGGEWRPIYDFIMRWINFGILVFFLVKVVGPLLIGFLNSQKSEIQNTIESRQKERDDMLAKVNEAKDSLENIGPRLDELRGRIVEQGERKKQELIQEANEQSQAMMNSAKRRIDNLILQGRQKIMIELLDMAMERALKRLPDEITPEDDNRLIQKHLKIAVNE